MQINTRLVLRATTDKPQCNCSLAVMDLVANSARSATRHTEVLLTTGPDRVALNSGPKGDWHNPTAAKCADRLASIRLVPGYMNKVGLAKTRSRNIYKHQVKSAGVTVSPPWRNVQCQPLGFVDASLAHWCGQPVRTAASPTEAVEVKHRKQYGMP